ncbi:MAG: hypothetical protein NTY90_04270 [Candidatus Micrarchaeota archaeon]|nr:hypothetical protein [Candidatus Micrarchaeota archaeon]
MAMKEMRKAAFEKQGVFRKGSMLFTGLSVAAIVLSPRAAKAEGLKNVFISPSERLVHENPALLASEEHQLKAGLELGAKHGGVNGIFVFKQGQKYRPALWVENKFYYLTERKGDYVAHPVENIVSLGAAKDILPRLKAGVEVNLSSGRGFGAAAKGGMFLSPTKGIDITGILGTQESQLGIHANLNTGTTLGAIVGNDVVAGEVRQKIRDVMANFTGGYGWKGGFKWAAGVAKGPVEVYAGFGPEAIRNLPKSALFAGVKVKFLPRKTVPSTGK